MNEESQQSSQVPRSSSLGKRLALVFAVVSVCMSLLWAAYLPLFSRYHAQEHFIRGMVASPLYVNGTLPRNLVDLTFKMDRHDFDRVENNLPRWERGELTLFPGYVPRAFSQYREYKDVPLNPSKRLRFKAKENVARYPVIGYLPHILVGWFSSYVPLPPVIMVYAVLFLMHLFGIMAGYFALRLLPCFHWPVFVMLLLPSNILLRQALYTDMICLSAAVLLFAFIVNRLWYRRSLYFHDKLILGILSLATAVTKMAYFPLALMPAVLPSGLFHRTSAKLGFLLSVFAVGSFLAVFNFHHAVSTQKEQSFSTVQLGAAALEHAAWVPVPVQYMIGKVVDTSVVDYPEIERGIREQVKFEQNHINRYKFAYVIQQPWDYTRKIIDTHVSQLGDIVFTGNFIWWPTKRQKSSPFQDIIPQIHVYLFAGIVLLGVLGLVAAPSSTPSQRLGLWFFPLQGRAITFVLILVTAFALNASMFLMMPSWDAAKGAQLVPWDTALGMQGRYYFPLVLFLFLVLVSERQVGDKARRFFGWFSALLSIVLLLLIHITHDAPYMAFYLHMKSLIGM